MPVAPLGRDPVAVHGAGCAEKVEPEDLLGAPLAPLGRCMYFPHAFWAAWNVGDVGLSPPAPALILIWAPPPVNFGSGKFVTPCARMHLENLSAFCSACLIWAADGLGRRDWHAFDAAWNVGEFGSIPLLDEIWVAPVLVGSGKFFTPCARMQLANLSASCRLPVPDVFCAVAAALVVVVVPRLATPGVDPPPQAENKRPTDTMVAVASSPTIDFFM